MNASLPVAIVFSAAGASMMNGSQRGPAKTRTPCAEPPSSSFTRNETVSPAGVVQVPVLLDGLPVVGASAAENTQSKTNSCAPAANGARSPGAVAVSGRSRNR